MGHYLDSLAHRKAFQRALNTALSLDPPLVVDGRLGPRTAAAVRLWRKVNGKGEAAVVDNEMLRLLGLGPALMTEPGTLGNIVAEPLIRLAASVLLNRLFPGKAIPMDSIVTTVKSAWFSKLNWTMAIGVVFNIFMLLGHPVPDDVQAAVITVGNSLVLIVGWVIRTWFTTSITAASAKKV